ncbi:hypothetical protein BJ684DRAFT_17481 [Piptocephalis cylindrospora]|uniref:Uncharacterized protein n=1 Tax=Piptocephalis cylindrospora TaxID=1907219 RepID=A0A4P9XZQ3_9FUNG|nr:hypothetical protein BJ684DRAFT_17481 [Piptocephalis cylindrospora]|eukprot:RKP11986.1 hypothetical protein BJ684DRAFT_17481 [Piptocephalis cylindrospora]
MLHLPLSLASLALLVSQQVVAPASNVAFKNASTLSPECSAVLGSRSFLEATSCNSQLLPDPTSSRDAFISGLAAYCDTECNGDQVISALHKLTKACVSPGSTITQDHPAHRAFINLYRAIPDREAICTVQASTGQWCVAPFQRPTSGYYSVEVNGSGCGECPHAVRQARMSWKERTKGLGGDPMVDRKVLQDTIRCSDRYENVPDLDSWVAHGASASRIKKSGASSLPVLRPFDYRAFLVVGTLLGGISFL